jgi:hypothetical protein
MRLEEAKDEYGNIISPILPDNKNNFLVDIDGTVTDDIPNEEPERMKTCLPFKDALIQVNKWYSEGHIITFFTSRTEEHRGITEEWLKTHGFNYHYLLMNKPRGGRYVWVDNHIVKGVRFKGIWSDLVTKNKSVTIFKEEEDE